MRHGNHRGTNFLANRLIARYGRCGKMENMWAVFRGIPEPDVYSFNLLMQALAHNGHLQQARSIFESMRGRDVVSWNTILTAYSRAGEIDSASRFMEILPQRTVVSWTSMLAAFSQKGGLAHEAKALFEAMPERDLVSWGALIGAFAGARLMLEARRVFDRIPCWSIVCWNALILGYAESLEEEVAIALFSEISRTMPEEIDSQTLISALQACSSLAAKENNDLEAVKLKTVDRGMMIHSQAIRSGVSCESDLFLASALVDMYSKCGCMPQARIIFDRMRAHDIVLWNSLLLGYVENEEASITLNLVHSMQESGICQPDTLTYIAAAKACIVLAASEQAGGRFLKPGALEKAMEIHSQATKLFPGASSPILLSTTLVDLYAECGSIEDCARVFMESPKLDVVLWTSLIVAFADNGHGELALQVFTYLQREFPANAAGFVAALKACSSCVALESGRAIHREIYRSYEDHHQLQACLVDFYCKAGSLASAQRVFDSATRNLVIWNSLIAGYSRQGDVGRVFRLFRRMRDEGLRPDGVTFLLLLNACSHAGLVNEGQKCFRVMEEMGIRARIEHHHCMVDMLGRANRLGEAIARAHSMPYQPNAVTRRTLLGACVNAADYQWLRKTRKDLH